MAEKWTNEQSEAIKTRDKNLLISAAAGSGKTAVLVERILSIITDLDNPVDIDRLLVVTFTKAAAAEMKSRLREKLINAQGINEDVLQRQLALLSQARISTFDSLCQSIVRENFTVLGIDPSFTVGDDDELHTLREQALDDVFEESYNKADFRALVESVCEKADDYELRRVTLEVYEFIQSVREPEEWLSKKAEEYNVSNSRVVVDFFKNAAYTRAQSELGYALSLLKRSVDCAPVEYYDELNGNIQAVINALSAKTPEEMASLINAVTFEKLPTARGADEESRKAAQESRNEAKSIIAEIKQKYFFKAPDAMEQDIAAAYPVVKSLSETVRRFSERYLELKNEKRVLSFSDIKQLCFRALVNNGYTDAAKEYAKLYKYVMVDEYQDTNDIEEGILDALSGGGKSGGRFMVGDVKQSIYRFRQAKPELFIEKSDLYSNNMQNGKLIALHQNFRSREFVLTAINFIFSQIMRRNSAEIEYDKSAALTAGARFNESVFKAVEVALIETSANEDAESTEEAGSGSAVELKALELEAIYIASEINRLIFEQETIIQDGDTARPARLSDIVILMRSGKKNGAIVSDILSAKGIPSYTEGKTGWFELTEISEILSLLQVIDNPLQEIPLLTVLCSSIFKFCPDELVEIRKSNENGWLYAVLYEYAKSGAEPEIRNKAQAFVERISEYRRLAAGMTITELLTYIYDDTDYFIIAGAMENGRLRQANLLSLLKRASDFEKTTYGSLFYFARYMERLKDRDALACAEAAPEDANAVKIMTIHKSKGLEFPIVFLAGCCSLFNLRDLNAQFIMHQQHGIGSMYVDYENRVKSTTLPRNIIKEFLRNESLAEEMRLLYVAMTRAKEMLYISGNVKNAERKLEKWNMISASEGRLFSPEAISSARSFMDWLMPAIMRSPSAAGFLGAQGLSFPVVDNEYIGAKFKCRVVYRNELAPPAEAENKPGEGHTRESFGEKIARITETPEACEAKITIDKLMNWKYNYESMPVKLTVSEIKTRWQRIISGDADTLPIGGSEAGAELENPVFMRGERGLSPAEKGTAVHTVLAHIDFETTRTEDGVLSVMDGLLERKILNAQEYEAVNVKEILAFVESDVAERIRCAENVRREVPFVIALSAEDAYLPPSQERVLVHGIIDCFFEENGSIIIIDYKTDYVGDGDFEAVRQKYKIQLDIYRKAAAKITQKPVSEVYLYMMRYGRLVEG